MQRLLTVPDRVELELTKRCNLRCRYCHFFDSPNEVEEELSTDEWLKFFDELGQLQVFRASVSGGEALMRDDFSDLIEGLVRNRMRFSLLSNGGLLTTSVAEFLAKTKRCEFVQISLDGHTAAIHDSFRGAGSFAAAVVALEKLKQKGLRSTVRITVGQHNINFLHEIIRFAVNELQIPVVSLNWASAMISNDKRPDSYELDLRQKLRGLQQLKELPSELFSHLSAESPPLQELKFFPSILERIRNKKKNSQELPLCVAPFHRFTVRADGAFCLCPHLPAITWGWANQTSIAQAWLNAEALNTMRKRSQCRIREEFSKCKMCEFGEYCRISCPALRASNEDGVGSCWCIKRYREAVPDFDFERMEFRS